MHMYGHEFYGGNGIVGAQVCFNCTIQISRCSNSLQLGYSSSSYVA